MTPDQYRKLREDAGLTQAKLAKLLAVSLRTIAGRENGTAPITLEAEYAIKYMRRLFAPDPAKKKAKH